MEILVDLAALLASALTLVAYHLFLRHRERTHPAYTIQTVTAIARTAWVESIMSEPGKEILAVQTLRNSLMSATMTASTAVLGLMGTATLAAPSLHASFAETTSSATHLTVRLALELVLMALLFASFVSSAMAVRYYNHVSFISAMPVGSETRARWAGAGLNYVRRAGLLYSWGLRQLVLVAPVLASILHPYAGPLTALVVVIVLIGFDRLGKS